MNPSPSSVSSAVQVARWREWDEHVPKLVQQALQQMLEPLPNLASDWHRIEVLRLLHEDTIERRRRLPLFARFDALDPLTVRDVAAGIDSEAEFSALLLLEVWQRVLLTLRQMQFDLLGYAEPPGVQESVAAARRRLQRQQRRRRMVEAPARPRRSDPAFKELFRPGVDVAKVISRLQIQGVLNADEQWVGVSGRKKELLALLIALGEGGYLANANRSALARGFAARFSYPVSGSLATRWETVPTALVEQYVQWFPPRRQLGKI